MAEPKWTPLLVEEQLAEAADVLKRLPNVTVQGYASTWPPYVREYWESYGVAEVTLRRPPPSAASIDRMDQALAWLRWLDAVDAKIIWLRANGDRWRMVCGTVGLSRAAAHRHWMFALCVIAWRLNGRQMPRNLSRQYVMERMNQA